MTVRRIWHGWTTPKNADLYQELLHCEVFPGIEAKEIEGYQSVELFRRDLKDEVEFMTIMTFDSIQSVIEFQGSDYEKSYVPDGAQKLLKRWDKTAAHFTAIEKRNYRL
ncbi:MAG: antibiotic biosynthesis monooxygenase [Bacteroidota bacterium]